MSYPSGNRALVDQGRLLDAIGIEAQLLLDSARGTRPDLPVPHCPGLTVESTVRHLGSIFRMSLNWIVSGESPVHWRKQPVEGEPLADYVRTGLHALLDLLGSHPPDTPAATWWSGDQTYGFWRRRMAHETTMHRIDIQQAAGIEVAAVDDEFAIDGIDEVLTLWFGQRLTTLGMAGTRNALVRVRTGSREWLARAGPAGTAAWRAAPGATGAVDAEVSSTPQQMYLWLWGRTRSVDVRGDDDAAAQLWALLRLATR